MPFFAGDARWRRGDEGRSAGLKNARDRPAVHQGTYYYRYRYLATISSTTRYSIVLPWFCQTKLQIALVDDSAPPACKRYYPTSYTNQMTEIVNCAPSHALWLVEERILSWSPGLMPFECDVFWTWCVCFAANLHVDGGKHWAAVAEEPTQEP